MTVTMSQPDLAALLERAAEMGALKALQHQRVSEEWGTQGVAAYLGVSTRTVARMVERGDLPPPLSGKWDAIALRRWRADRRGLN